RARFRHGARLETCHQWSKCVFCPDPTYHQKTIERRFHKFQFHRSHRPTISHSVRATGRLHQRQSSAASFPCVHLPLRAHTYPVWFSRRAAGTKYTGHQETIEKESSCPHTTALLH